MPHGRPDPNTDPERIGIARLLGRQVIEELLPPEVIRRAHQRIAEGLDATSQKVFQRDGEVIYSAPLVDWTERREYAREVLKLADHYPSHEVGEGVTVQVHVAGVNMARLVGVDPQSLVGGSGLEPGNADILPQDVVVATVEPPEALPAPAHDMSSDTGDRGERQGITASTGNTDNASFSETVPKPSAVQKRQRTRKVARMAT